LQAEESQRIWEEAADAFKEKVKNRQLVEIDPGPDEYEGSDEFQG
jgi:hypothetical protein